INGYSYFDTVYVSPDNFKVRTYVAKYSSDGDFRWVNYGRGGSQSNHYIGFKTDDKGNGYLSGCIHNTVYFDSDSISSWGYDDAFLAKVDSSGHWLWARHAGWGLQDESLNVGLDSSGNVYLKGFFDSPTLHIGSFILNNASGDDFFVAKYDSSGTVLWAVRGWKNGMNPSFCVDKAGNSYLTTNSKFIYKYDTNGNFVYAANNASAYNNAMIADDSGSVYITGSFVDSVTFGNTHLNAIYTYQSFVTKLEFPAQSNAIHDLSEKEELIIYPNPTIGLLSISGKIKEKGSVTLCIRTALGELICVEKCAATYSMFSKQLDIGTLPRGIYFVELSDGETIFETKKIVLQ
ncbi:MAG: T9SS type A sorting domain-containing protein, partial [Bacteroidia bacterium]